MRTPYCQECGSMENLQDHHIIPKSEGGSSSFDNIKTLCVECHSKVHGRNLRETLVRKVGKERGEPRNEDGDSTCKNRLKRAHVKDETHRRVKLYASRRNITIKEAYKRIINKLLDKDSEERNLFLEKEECEMLKETAETMEMTTAELVKYAISTVKMLFSDDLSFSDTIKPLPEIWETLEEKREHE